MDGVLTMIKCLQQRPRPKGWMHRTMSPEDMMLQLFSLQRPRTGTSPEGNGAEHSDMGRDLLQLLLTFDANTDEEDENDEDEDEDGSSDNGRGDATQW